MTSIGTCLWFDNEAAEAAQFYTSIFPNSRIGETSYYGDNLHKPKGSVMTVRFWLDGREFLALNGGPMYKFTEAISLTVAVDTQEELDRIWGRLTDGGKEVACSWLKDRYGLSWQIFPSKLIAMISDPNRERAARVHQAVTTMIKLDLKVLEEVYKG